VHCELAIAAHFHIVTVVAISVSIPARALAGLACADGQVMALVCMASEFDQIRVRPEELADHRGVVGFCS
jgi:hypothetical protein